MAALYVTAGTAHLLMPAPYLRIVPAWVPAPEAAVFWSGLLEIALGILLLFRTTRRFAAIGVIILLIAVFPANVKMALDRWDAGHPAAWATWLRLPAQGLLIWWAWKVRNR